LTAPAEGYDWIMTTRLDIELAVSTTKFTVTGDETEGTWEEIT